MTGPWLVSYVALWLIVAAMLVASLALGRQIGLLHRRIPAADDAPAASASVGDAMVPSPARSLGGSEIEIGGPGPRRLYMFIAPGCVGCAAIAESLRSAADAASGGTQLVLVSTDPDEERNREFVEHHRLAEIPLVMSPRAALRNGVSDTPYGILVDEQGTIEVAAAANSPERVIGFLKHGKSDQEPTKDGGTDRTTPPFARAEDPRGVDDGS